MSNQHSSDAVLVCEGVDAGQIWHCGQPWAEQRKLLSGDAWVHLSQRPVLQVVGKDARRFMHALSTRNIDQWKIGQMGAGFFLDAQGHIRFAFEGKIQADSTLAPQEGNAVDQLSNAIAEEFWLHTEPGFGEALQQYLQAMVFSMQVQIDLRPDFTVVETGGNNVDTKYWAGSEFADQRSTERKIIAKSELDNWRCKQQVGIWASEAIRIADGIPRWGLDTDENTIPNELALYGIDRGKGCYPGQEVVSKIHNLGKPLRRLVRLSFDDATQTPPALGTTVLDGYGEPVGFMGSSAVSWEFGLIGLALIKRQTPKSDTLYVAGRPTVQEVIAN